MVLAATDEIRNAARSAWSFGWLMLVIADLETEFPACVAVCERGDPFVVIDIEHATYIPHELLIAISGPTGTQVLRSVPIKGLADVVGDIESR